MEWGYVEIPALSELNRLRIDIPFWYVLSVIAFNFKIMPYPFRTLWIAILLFGNFLVAAIYFHILEI
jgi:hypothetical protein